MDVMDSRLILPQWTHLGDRLDFGLHLDLVGHEDLCGLSAMNVPFGVKLPTRRAVLDVMADLLD